MKWTGVAVLAGLSAAACVEKPPALATVGEAVSPVYVVDGPSGKCIKLQGSGKFFEMTLATPEQCVDNRTTKLTQATLQAQR